MTTQVWFVCANAHALAGVPNARFPFAVNWILDELPAAVRMYEEDAPGKVHLERGFPLGFYTDQEGPKRYFIFNHIQFIIGYHQEASSASLSKDGADAPAVETVNPKDHEKAAEVGASYRIVGFEVEPFTGKPSSCGRDHVLMP
jgi:hypothetical protein